MDDDGYLPLSAVFRFAHCPRQAYLFHREGAIAENRFTVEGNLLHTRVTEGEDETRPGVRICRSLWLVSHRLRVRGVADVVEFHAGVPVPIEYKRGARKQREDEHAQLALQALCLEEMLGIPVPTGFIFHGLSKRREAVAITPDMRIQVERLLADVRTCIEAVTAPVAVLGRWCEACSLNDHCQPAATGGRSAKDWLTARVEA